MSTASQQTAPLPHYAMHIAWSAKDKAYLVSLPEWMPRLLNDIAVTHGATYEEAARNGQEALLVLIEDARARGEALPEPQMVDYDDEPIENIDRENEALAAGLGQCADPSA